MDRPKYVLWRFKQLYLYSSVWLTDWLIANFAQDHIRPLLVVYTATLSFYYRKMDFVILYLLIISCNIWETPLKYDIIDDSFWDPLLGSLPAMIRNLFECNAKLL